MISCSHWGLFDLALPDHLMVVGEGEYAPIVAVKWSPSELNDAARRFMAGRRD